MVLKIEHYGPGHIALQHTIAQAVPWISLLSMHPSLIPETLRFASDLIWWYFMNFQLIFPCVFLALLLWCLKLTWRCCHHQRRHSQNSAVGIRRCLKQHGNDLTTASEHGPKTRGEVTSGSWSWRNVDEHLEKNLSINFANQQFCLNVATAHR